MHMRKIISIILCCLLALSAAGEVYAWGQGLQGQTANEKKVDTNIPHVIDSLKDSRVKMIAAGGSHSAVVDEQGRLFTVGEGDDWEVVRVRAERTAGERR